VPELPTTVLLLDADGNLFPSEEPAFVASAAVTNAYLDALGLTVRFTAEELRRATTGKNFRTTAVDLAVSHGVAVDPSLGVRHPDAVTREPVLTADLLEHWVREERRQVTAYLGSVLRPDPSVLEPLSRLAGRHRLAAVSSSATARLTACFDATGLSGLVPEPDRFSAEDSLPVPTSKPDPAVYLFACDRLGVAPAQALAVEDSVPGAESAVAAGIATIGNVQFVPPRERAERAFELEAAGVRAVVASWTELELLLQAPDAVVRLPAS
jgi:HAD superfamily hydrolase (TIGR01509 family)